MLLVLMLLVNYSKNLDAVDGIIWSKKHQNFIPLFSISTFSVAKDEYLLKGRELEYHNFQKEDLRVAYFQETNIVSFINNDTGISGVCGDLWTTLAEYLNFTLIPVKLENRHFGNEMKNGSYDGLLGLIQRNDSQIIPRSGIFMSRLSLLDYTIPIWTVRYHLYITPEWKHDEAWMLRLFSENVWYAYFILLLALSVLGYIHEKNDVKASMEKIHFNLLDHIFYTVAIAYSQGSVPLEFHNKSKIIYICTSMFSWVILIAFSSHAIFRMMNKKFVLPFTSLRSLIQESKYDVIAFSGSMVHTEFEETIHKYMRYRRDFARVSYASSAYDLFKKVCFTEKRKYAAFEAEDRHKAIGKNVCRLLPTEASYFETWVSSAIKKGFKYKRSFDVGILKMIESGLVDGLKDRWLDWKMEENDDISFQSIDLQQVYLIFGILFVGLTMSIFILLIEYVTFFRNIRFKSSKKPNKLQVMAKSKVIKNNRNHILLVRGNFFKKI